MTHRRWFLFLTGLLGEGILTLVLVGIFFVIVMGFLTVGFPEGTRLAQVVLPESLGGFSRQPSTRTLAMEDRTAGADPEDTAILASIVTLSGRVMDKPPNAFAWNQTLEGTGLGDRHTVQTLDRSRATVSFQGDEDLRMEENSLIIVRRYRKRPELRRRRSGLIVLEGELSGRLAMAGEGEDEVVILAATQEALLRPRSGTDESVDFSVKVNPDRTSTLAVYSGSAEVNVGGDSLVIEENQFLSLSEGGMPPDPRPLPTPPGLSRPTQDAVFHYGSVSAAVEFEWSGDELADAYEFVLARDPEFKEIVHRESVPRTGFTHGHLKRGDYYWRVYGVTGWAKSTGSRVRRFTVMRDTHAPALTVRFPDEAVKESTILLSGITEPGSEVYVGDRKVTVHDSGEFEWLLQLDAGLNVVVVSAVDPAGNMATESRIVNAQF